MPTTTISITQRSIGVSARNDKFPRLSENAACRTLTEFKAFAHVNPKTGGGHEVSDLKVSPERLGVGAVPQRATPLVTRVPILGRCPMVQS